MKKEMPVVKRPRQLVIVGAKSVEITDIRSRGTSNQGGQVILSFAA